MPNPDMNQNKLRNSCRALWAALLLAIALDHAAAENWPGWRGPRGDGTSIETNVLVEWDVARHAIWKTAVPGAGHASPIAWGERIFTVTALPDSGDRLLLCFDRATGQILWRQTVVSGPLERIHRENSYASGTPATDGQRVYAAFRVGDEVVIAAHDFASGNPLWRTRLGTHTGEWGFSNEPVLHGDMVILDGDSKGDSFLVALGRKDGQIRWRVSRTRRGISYSAPLIRPMAGRLQMIQCGDRSVTSFDPDSGKPLWTVDGPSEEFVATPVYSEKAELVFISSSWPQRHILAIRPNGSGNVTGTHVAWRDDRGAPYVPSLIVAGDFLLSLNNSGVAFCYDAATGKVHWQERLGRHHASPVRAGGLVYFINDDGEINVIRPGPAYDRVGKHALGESCYASPAISDGHVFLRGFQHLFCLGRTAK